MIRRRAVSLIELLVALSACSFIMTLSATLMHRIMRAHADSRAIVDQERSSIRLAQQFRRDVRQAKSADFSEPQLDGVFLVLSSQEFGTVKYRRSAETIERIAEAPGKMIARELFGFGTELDTGLDRSSDTLQLITLSLHERRAEDSSVVAKSPAKPVHFRVQARLGADYSFGKTPLADDFAELK